MFRKLVNKRRVRQAVKYLQNKRKENPELSEDAICRLLLRNWIYNTPRMKMKSINIIDRYINDLLKKELTLSEVCFQGIVMEFEDYYGFFHGYSVGDPKFFSNGRRLDKYSRRWSDLENQISIILGSN